MNDKEIKDIIDGLDLPETTTKDELTALVAEELRKREQTKDKDKSELALVRAEVQHLRDEQAKLADKALDERDRDEVERKVVRDISDADKDSAVRHADEIAERAEKVMPRGVPIDAFEVPERFNERGVEHSRPATDLDKLYLFPTGDPLIESWKQGMEDAYAVSAMTGVPFRETKLFQHYEKVNPEFSKAMAAATSGSGADWIPTGYSDQVIDLVRTPHALITQHPHIVMPTSSFVMPAVASDMTVYIAGERTLDDDVKFTASTMGTTNKTLTAKTLAVRSIFSGIFDEDSLIPVLPQIRENLGFVLRSALDDAMVRGDTTATHHDTGYTVAAADVRRLWRGYVETALTYSGSANVLQMTGAFNFDNVLKLQGFMEQYGAQGEETLMFVTGYDGYRQLKGLKDSQNNNIMVDYGAGRTSQNVPTLDGIQVVRTDKVRADLTSLGIYDGATTGHTNLLLVYKPAYVIGDRRSLQLQVVPKPEQDQQALVGLMRIACTNVYEAATHYTVALGYGI